MPPGFVYTPDFLTADEERDILAEIEAYPFHEVVMRGQAARRTVIHFGWDYDYDSIPPIKELRYSISTRTLRRK